ncbi:Clp protease N-terminal domain-containing protein [Propylenella binzhouense]|uniref:Clp protease N-terminal domain-containing protein n=1 Tax=Propylenella binzhouense TaxID=2555902 RepID=UPI0013717267|nr:Clp protease N-terminal domain-containing protein [Propylenella binzhouense]
MFGRRGGLFDKFFGDEFLGRSPFGERGGLSEPTAPRALDRARRSGEAEERISDHAKELLQSAARHAVEHRRTEVDTEHLLIALTKSDVVRTIIAQFKVSTQGTVQSWSR